MRRRPRARCRWNPFAVGMIAAGIAMILCFMPLWAWGIAVALGLIVCGLLLL